jgi:hypothetical protein
VREKLTYGSYWKITDSEDASARGDGTRTERDRILWENGLLRRIQETEYRTENMKSLVYVLYDCGTNNCSSAR